MLDVGCWMLDVGCWMLSPAQQPCSFPSPRFGPVIVPYYRGVPLRLRQVSTFVEITPESRVTCRMSDPNTAPMPGIEVRTYFVRGRNALVARADFGELYVDYYLHQGQYGYQHEPAYDAMLKEALAAITLHSASRPWNESWAWTIHFAQPLLNLFVTGDNRRGMIVGQLFTENVKADDRGRFLAEMVRERGEPRRSVVE